MQIDNLAAETAAYLTTKHPDFAVLAARIAISNLYKETKDKFSGKLILKLILSERKPYLAINCLLHIMIYYYCFHIIM